MNAFVSNVRYVFPCSLSVLLVQACGSPDITRQFRELNSDASVSSQCDPKSKGIDFENPPSNCGPQDYGDIKPSSNLTDIATCPMDSSCMVRTKQSGDVANLRMSRLQLWAPSPLLSLDYLINSKMNSKCFKNGSEEFNWLMQFNLATNELTTGGAHKSTDGQTFQFANEDFDQKKIEALCPGFVGPTQPISIGPVKTTFTKENGLIRTPKLSFINVPIFDPANPIILPLRDAYLQNVALSENNSCIGKWQPEYWESGETLGWTTGGAVVGKIKIEDADRIPVSLMNCSSVCSLLAPSDQVMSNPARKAQENPGNVCKRGADGKIGEIGDTCVDGPPGCKNAFLLSASFSAYGVTISK